MFGFLVGCVGTVSFLPEELASAQEWLWVLELPALTRNQTMIILLLDMLNNYKNQ